MVVLQDKCSCRRRIRCSPGPHKRGPPQSVRSCQTFPALERGLAGQTSTQRAHFMQGVESGVTASSSVKASRQDVVLVTGTSRPNWAWPIIAPLTTTLPGFWLNPPAASNTCAKGVPMGTRKFPGSAMGVPVTVTPEIRAHRPYSQSRAGL